MNDELKKSLSDLIDETLVELEELKKSRFSAAEISIKGPGADALAGHPVNGKLAAKAEDEKDEDKDKDEAEKADVEKGEGVLDEAEKAEDKKDDDKDDEEGSPEHEDKEKKLAKELLNMHKSVEEIGTLKKSVDGMESLMKSYVDEKVAPLESKLSTILDMVQKIAETPASAKGVGHRDIAPLRKSTEEGESLSKSEVASKLFELKKSGTRVDSTDIARAEMGHDLAKIISKYNIQ